MDYIKILSVLRKGLTALPTLIAAGKDVTPLVLEMAEVAKGKKVTDERLDALEASIKADLDEFNSPLPPE